MTLNQIGGIFNRKKFSGVYNLEESSLVKQSIGTVTSYQYDKQTNKWWGSAAVNQEAFCFNGDGSKAYLLSTDTDRIYQYNASAFFDASNLTEDFIYTQLSDVTGTPTSFAYSPDGLRMYVCDSSNKIFQYSLGAAYNLSTLTYVKNAPLQAGLNHRQASISADGTKIFFTTLTDNWVQSYNLATAWDVATLTYNSTNRFKHIPSGSANTLQYVTFSVDGSKMYILPTEGRYATQYNLSTPYDLTTAANSVDLLERANLAASVYDSSGSYLYCMDSNGVIQQYTLGTVYRISTATPVLQGTAQFGGGPTTGFRDLKFKSDGTVAYVLNDSTDEIYQYNLGTAWDVTTLSYASKSFGLSLTMLSLAQTGFESLPTSITFSPDGTKLFVYGSSIDFLYEFDVGTAWDVSTARWGIEMSNITTTAQDTLPTDIAFSSDGTKMYVLGDTNNTLYQYTLSTAWDVKTASYASKTLAVGTQDPLPVSFRFSDDGTKGYMLGDTNNTVYQYTFTTAWDISTGSYATKSFSVNLQEPLPTGLAFGDSGLKMYVVGTTNDRVYQYNLSTAWDVSTAVYSNLSLLSSETTPQAIAISPDGTKMAFTGNTGDVIRLINFSTPWNLGTAVFSASTLSIANQDGDVTGIDFSSDGTKLYLIGRTNDRVFQIYLSTPWNPLTSTYKRLSLTGLNLSIYKTEIDPTGQYVFGVTGGQLSNQLYRITLATAWTTTGGYSGSVNTFLGGWIPGSTNPTGLAFSSDGTRLLTGSSRGFAIGYELTTAWTPSTIKLDTLSISGSATAIEFKYDGTVFYHNDGSGGFYTHNCPTPYDLNTINYGSHVYQTINTVPGNVTTSSFYNFYLRTDGNKLQVLSAAAGKYLIEFDLINGIAFQGSLYIGGQILTATAMCFSAEGADLYVTSANTIYQYKLTTPFDLRYASYYSSYSTAAFDSAIKAIDIAPTGTSIYIAGDITDVISEIRMTTPHDITKAYYIDVSPLISQDSAPGAVRFSADGTSMYVLGTSTRTIYQYTCSTPFDAKTAVYASKSFSVASLAASVSDFYLDSTGETAFIANDSSLQANQFRLATPWDISTAYAIKSISFATQTSSNASWATFGNNGTKLYLAVTQLSTGYVYQYTLTTPYDITTRVYDNKTFVSPDSNPTGILLNDTGTRLFLLGDSNNRIFQYKLTTPWDIANRETFKSFTLTGQDSAPQNLVFKPDGTKMYVVGQTNDRIYQYTLTTPFDITTTVYDNKSFALPAIQSSPSSLYFRDDGLRVYVWDYDYDRCHEYRLSTAWDISTASWVKSRILNGLNQNARGFAFKPDGTTVYVIDSTDNAIYQYSLSTAWDINTLAYASKVFNVSAIESGCAGVELSADGTFVYFIGSTNDRIFQYKLGTAWDVSTAVSSVKSFSLASQDSSMQGGAFSWNGLKFYAVGYTNDRVYQYDLSTAWDISTAVYANKFLSIGTQETLASGLDVSDDGTKVYIVGTSSDTVYQYNLSTAYDISTATYSNKSKSVATQDTAPVGFRISRDGLKAAVLGSTNDRIYYYTLTTAWDISTLTSTGSSGLVSTQELNPTGFFIAQGSGETGTKLFVVGDTSDKVNRYTTATWSASTFTYQSGLSSNDYSIYNGNAVDVMMSADGDKMYVMGLNNIVYQFDVIAPNEANTANMGYLSVTSLESVPEKIRFNNDGTKLFLMGSSGDDINVFTLPSNAPWIASAAVYTAVSGSITDTIPYGMAIKPDGSRYYTCGTNDVIRQWTPSSNYGVSLTSTGTADISPTLLDPKDIAFSPDGLKLFVLGDTTIYEYSVEVAWEANAVNTQWRALTDGIVRAGAWSADGLKCFTLGESGDVIHVQNATYPWNLTSLGTATIFINLGLIETNGRGLYLKPDGSKLYLIGLALDSVVEYSMTNYTLPVSTGKQVNITWETTDPSGLAFSSDGTSFYTISNAGAVRQFQLDIPWDIGSTFVPSVSYPGDISPYSMFIGDSGSKIFVTGLSNDTLITYALGAPWNIGSLTLLRSYSGINSEGIVTGHTWKPDGLKFFTLGQAIDEIREYTLTTAWNTSTASYSGKRIELLRATNATSLGDPIGLLINDDGTRLYTTPAGTGTMYSLELTNGYDVNSFAHGGIYFGASDSTFRNFCFNGSGTRMYIAGRTNDSLIQFNLANAFRLTSAVSAAKSASISSADGNVQGIDCSPDASKFYVIGSFNNRINELSNSLSTGELGTLTLSATSIAMATYEATSLGLSINDLGKKVSVVGSGADKVWQFELSTGYNINSWDTRKFSIASQELNVRGMALSPDGYKLFIYGTTGVIFQYDIPLSGAISFAAYSGKFLYVGSLVGGSATPIDISFAHNGLYFYLLDGQTNANAFVQRYGLLGF